MRPSTIVFILADDLGYGDVGAYNAARVGDTPNVDTLASTGLRLTNFHSNSPACSPSRASFMLGRESSVAGYPNIADCEPSAPGTYYADRSGIRRQTGTDAVGRLNETWPSVASTLRSAGYATMHLGKWHMGCDGLPNYARYGWDSFKGWNANGDFANPGWPTYALFKEWTWTDKHAMGEALVRDATRFLLGPKVKGPDDPVYLSVNPVLPHAPLAPRREHMARVGPRDCDLDEFWANNFTWTWATNSRFRPLYGSKARGSKACVERVYRASVYSLDRLVGDVLDAVFQVAGRDPDDTLVIFTSDNGPEVNLNRLTWSQVGTTNGFRGFKRSLYEGGTRVPFVARWPRAQLGRSNPVSDLDVQAIDLLPTLAFLVGVDLGHHHDDALGPFPGRVAPCLVPERRLFSKNGKKKPSSGSSRALSHSKTTARWERGDQRTIFADWEYPVSGKCAGVSPTFAGRRRDSGLKILLELPVHFAPESLPMKPSSNLFVRAELYNLTDDPFETRNLIPDDDLDRVPDAIPLAADFLYWIHHRRPPVQGVNHASHPKCRPPQNRTAAPASSRHRKKPSYFHPIDRGGHSHRQWSNVTGLRRSGGTSYRPRSNITATHSVWPRTDRRWRPNATAVHRHTYSHRPRSNMTAAWSRTDRRRRSNATVYRHTFSYRPRSNITATHWAWPRRPAHRPPRPAVAVEPAQAPARASSHVGAGPLDAIAKKRPPMRVFYARSAEKKHNEPGTTSSPLPPKK